MPIGFSFVVPCGRFPAIFCMGDFMFKNNNVVKLRSVVLGAVTAAASGLASAAADPTTAVAIAKTISLTDANTAQLISTAALVGLFVTAAGGSIVLRRIQKANHA